MEANSDGFLYSMFFYPFNLIEGAMSECMSLVRLSKLAYEGSNYRYLLIFYLEVLFAILRIGFVQLKPLISCSC